MQQKIVNDNKTVLDIIETNLLKSQMIDFAEWFNMNQWSGGKGDKVKGLFVKCDYKGIVDEYFKQREND